MAPAAHPADLEPAEQQQSAAEALAYLGRYYCELLREAEEEEGRQRAILAGGEARSRWLAYCTANAALRRVRALEVEVWEAAARAGDVARWESAERCELLSTRAAAGVRLLTHGAGGEAAGRAQLLQSEARRREELGVHCQAATQALLRGHWAREAADRAQYRFEREQQLRFRCGSLVQQESLARRELHVACFETGMVTLLREARKGLGGAMRAQSLRLGELLRRRAVRTRSDEAAARQRLEARHAGVWQQDRACWALLQLQARQEEVRSRLLEARAQLSCEVAARAAAELRAIQRSNMLASRAAACPGGQERPLGLHGADQRLLDGEVRAAQRLHEQLLREAALARREKALAQRKQRLAAQEAALGQERAHQAAMVAMERAAQRRSADSAAASRARVLALTATTA
eukprot:TRINITY_DN22322_c0_g1_i2.p1 TRINITY_DN22322_c0_g1~~TRINITY_DN22322_c0_g1_i2.p1  ORF type:complete len:406 (+),score=80.27 TRINITY_DN22322_c0_g1_i2:283-1500(+)